MPQFLVDEDLARTIERLADPKPFENLSFNAALRRVISECLLSKKKVSKEDDMAELDQLLAESLAMAARRAKKLPSPSSSSWAKEIPELRYKGNFGTWKSICIFLGIETKGDSARRKLADWVAENKPNWAPVPGL